MRPRQRPDAPLLVTTAQPSHLEEVRDRRVQYTITMSIRTACFFLIIVLPGWPLKVAALAGAALLPWVAVQAANLPYRQGRAPRFREPRRRAIEGRAADALPYRDEPG